MMQRDVEDMRVGRCIKALTFIAVVLLFPMLAACAPKEESVYAGAVGKDPAYSCEELLPDAEPAQPAGVGVTEKTIYLTFDDGPSSPVTDNILDVLKEKKVKATFFVIGNKIRARQKLTKRILDEGNAIGLHTYTHDYGKIYRNEEAFITEMDRTSDEIFSATGIRTSLIRFPTGSKGHLNKSFHEKLKAKGYKTYDWNARVTDGVHPGYSARKFVKEAAKTGLKWDTVFMLMHCDELNLNTCKALPDIIDYFKMNHYTFRIIDKDTPEYYFRYEKKR